jgi:hypothetical protein
VLDPLDLYAPKVSAQPERTCEALLRKGANELRFEITGTHPQARPANYMLGLDYLRIE